jgi:hypothetical protein
MTRPNDGMVETARSLTILSPQQRSIMRPCRLAIPVSLVACLFPLFVLCRQADAQSVDIVRQCRTIAVDDQLQPIPDELVAAAQKLFGTAVPPDVMKAETVYRCMGKQIWLCTAGANLVCEKANGRRTSAGASQWCRQNPNSQTVPMSATGHDARYFWTCAGTSARVAGDAFHLDQRGFIRENWRRLP